MTSNTPDPTRRDVLASTAALPLATDSDWLDWDLFGPSYDLRVEDQQSGTTTDDPSRILLSSNLTSEAIEDGVRIDASAAASPFSYNDRDNLAADDPIEVPATYSDRVLTPSTPATVVVHKADDGTIYADGQGVADGFSTSGTDAKAILEAVGENIPPGGEIAIVDATLEVINLWDSLSTGRLFSVRGVGDAKIKFSSEPGEGDRLISIEGASLGDYEGLELRGVELDGSTVGTDSSDFSNLLHLGYVDDVVLDGVDALGAPNRGYGLALNRCRGFRVRDYDSDGCYIGADLDGSTGGMLSGCETSNSEYAGVLLNGSNSNIVANGIVSDGLWQLTGENIAFSGGECGEIRVNGGSSSITDDVKISDVTIEGGVLDLGAGTDDDTRYVQATNVTSKDSSSYGVSIGGSSAMEAKLVNVTVVNSSDQCFTIGGDGDTILQSPTAKDGGVYGFTLSGNSVRVSDATYSGNGSPVSVGSDLVYWDGIIGGGPIDGVDLGSISGQEIGDLGISDGTSNTAGNLYRWDGSAWNSV